ncbi:MAG: DUF1800 domain-containing protein [Pyrinomonadaceae bacterium]
MKTKQQGSLKRLWQHCVYTCLMAFAICGAATLTIRAQVDASDPSNPILISEADSTRALATNSGNWRGGLPKASTQVFQPGADSRAVIFVSNLDLMEGEGANAFRVYAEDASGKAYRLPVEGISPLSKQPWIYGVTVKLYDEIGYNGQPAGDGDVLLRLTWRGMTSNRVLFGLGATGGNLKNDKGAVPTPASLVAPSNVGIDFAYNTAGDMDRFAEQGAFGSNPALDLRLRQLGIQRWIEDQFNKQPTYPYPNKAQRVSDPNALATVPTSCHSVDNSTTNTVIYNLCVRDTYTQYQNQNWMFKEALYGNDQLRRRVSWALSQIWVVSGSGGVTQQQRHEQEYFEVLDRHAFGNYRNLMGEMTLNPAMGNYLDMIRSSKNNPNENYPREIMQLFTVGLDMLNQDGTPVLVGGNRVPTYDQNAIIQFTKVFTGWTLCNSGTNPACPNAVAGVSNYIDPMILSGNANSVGGNHDTGAKTLFSYPGAPFTTIAACSNCVGATAAGDAARTAYANASLSQTLDNIFYHPNVGPFVATRLIQNLVTGDPTPAYVGRVAAVFNNNGVGVRGDMKAVIRAVLLDREARGAIKTAPDYGKLREPFQLATNLLRSFDVKSAARTQNSDGYLNPQVAALSQNVWNSPSVFNYFPADYIVPGTTLNGPEFGILNTTTSFNRINFVRTMVYSQIGCNTTGTPPACDPNGAAPLGTSISLAQPMAWAGQDATGDILIESLNQKMMHGAMSTAMRNQLRTAINVTGITPLQKAQQALYLVATSSQYQVQR